MRNAIIQALRRSGATKRSDRATDPLVAELRSSAPTASALVSGRQGFRRIIAAMAKLPERQRQAIYLRLLRGIDALYDTPTPYIAAWHQAPVSVSRGDIRLNGGRELQRCLYAFAVKALLGDDVAISASLLYPREPIDLQLDDPEAVLVAEAMKFWGIDLYEVSDCSVPSLRMRSQRRHEPVRA